MTSSLEQDPLTRYRQAGAPLPEHNRLWPLYGAGLGNLGREGRPIETPMPPYGPGELLVRHDACGLCFSDIKVIKLGPEHPRIYRDMREHPVTLGHEVCMTVVGVGADLEDQYRVGSRFIVQADIFVGGVGYAYGYEIQGGLSQYNVIDQRILNGDDGNYLIPVEPETGYAEAALTEPWACVTAAYGLAYRTGLKAGGTTWIIGKAGQPAPGELPDYTISTGFDSASHPARLMLTDVPAGLAGRLRETAAALGVAVTEQPPGAGQPPAASVDDIVLLDADPDLVEVVSPCLADHGVLAVISGEPMPRPVAVDVGRIHYNRWVYVGGRGPDISEAYRWSRTPGLAQTALKPGGRAWFVGAGGPMGRMHVQRALQATERPAAIVCTDVSDARLEDLSRTFAAEARAQGIEWHCLNPAHPADHAALVAFQEQGFDDVVVLAPVPAVISDAAGYLAAGGVMNIFAGVARGTVAHLNLSDAYLRGVRVIGHSASTIDDLRLTLFQAETGRLSPNRSVAAVGSLGAVRDGLQSVLDTSFPGKVVIYPNIREMPLTALPDLGEVLPSVHALLKDGREWTVEAENEFLRLML